MHTVALWWAHTVILTGGGTSNRAWIGYTFIYFPYMHNPQKTNPQKNQPTLQWNLSQNKESSLKEKVLIKFENERKPSSKITHIGKIAI